MLVIGLGNPGVSYERTRHNAGFQAIDVLSREFGTGEEREQSKFLARTQDARIVAAPVLFVKPQTYMNRSGESVRKIVDFYKLDPAKQILVLCDDIDLPPGELRLRMQGSAGTHNGLKSLCDQFGEEYPRLRIGIGKQSPGEDLAQWVLSSFSPAEQEILGVSLGRIPELVTKFVLGER